MAKFKFRLQGFLNVKEKIEDQRRMDYGKAVAALEDEKQKKIALENERSGKLNEFSGLVRNKIEPQAFAQYNMYLDYLKQRINEQQKEVEKAEKKVEEKRLVLIEAMKEKKTLQTLRDRDYAEFIEEEKRAEQRMVDEIVSYKYANGDKSETGEGEKERG